MPKLTLVRDEDTRDELTDRQRVILDFISQYIRDHGYPPTLREIGSQFTIKSTNGVNDHLRALEKKGYLHRDDLKSRALRPVDAGGPANGQTPGEDTDTIEVPILGRVAAGQPLLAVRSYEDTVRVDRFFIGNNREVFALSRMLQFADASLLAIWISRSCWFLWHLSWHHQFAFSDDMVVG